MKSKMFAVAVIISVLLLLGMVLIPGNPLYGINWALISVVIIGLAMLAFFWQFERKKANAKEITLLATMASLAAIARIPFAAIMGLQPTTFIVMITGYVFGAQAGFMVGCIAALVSNFFLGQGPWTPWQMFSWGICGVIGGLIGHKGKFHLIIFTIIAGLCGYLFGWIMNIWHWIAFVNPLNWTTFFAAYVMSFPSDTIHAAGNVAFSLLFGKSFYNILLRFRSKFQTTFIDPG
ncbi:MAG TPA: ECF transporter S component [Syntrophomonadaceae bacterium]|nr:ECF transporter S component [Syntrophomonadaceae bacterium]